MMELKQQMDAIDPRLWYVAIAVFVGFMVWAWKKVHPRSFRAMPPRLKALPATLLAAALSAATSEEFWPLVFEAVLGGLSGVTAVGGHEFLDRLASGSKADRALKRAAESSEES